MKTKRFWWSCALCAVVFLAGSKLVQAAAITFNWSAAGATFVQPADNNAFNLTLQIQPNTGTMTLAEGEVSTIHLADFSWAVNTSAQGSLSIVADRLLTIDGVGQLIDQDFNFSVAAYSSMFGGYIKSGYFNQSALLTYDFGDRGMVDVLLLQVKCPTGLGTTGTSAYSLISQGNGLLAQFTAYNIVPEPATCLLLALGAVSVRKRLKR